MNSGIYSLIARNTLNNEAITIPIKELNGADTKYKVNISSIDKLTTYFENEQQLSKRLFDRKYIPFPNADIFIRYKQDSVYHDLEVLYKECKEDGNTVIVVTHNSLFPDIADKVIYLKNGELENIVINENPKAINEVDW